MKNSVFLEIFELPRVYWYYALSHGMLSICCTILEFVGPAFLTSYFHYTPLKAGSVFGLAPLAALVVPFFGKLVDEFG